MFALTLTLFVWCCNRSTRPAYGLVAGGLAAAAYGLRTIGIAALVAWVAESLANRRFRQAAIRLPLALIPIACWVSYISLVESGQEYRNVAYKYQRADYLFYNVSYGRNISLKDPFSPELGYATFGDVVRRVLSNLEAIPSSLGEAVSSKKSFWELQLASFNHRIGLNMLGPWTIHAILIFFGLLVIGGFTLQLLRRQWIVPFLTVLSVFGICSTPWPQQFIRYLAPLLPFLALFFLQSVLAIKGQLSKLRGRTGRRAGAACGVAIVSLIFLSQARTLGMVYKYWHQPVHYQGADGKIVSYRLFFYSDAYRALDAGLDWLRLRAKPDDIVASSMPHWVFLRTGLKSVMPPFEINPVQAQALLDSVPVRFLIVDEGLAVDTRRYAVPVVEMFPGNWKRIYSDSIGAESGEVLTDRFAIYQRVRAQ
jgi:hypothetical protein